GPTGKGSPRSCDLAEAVQLAGAWPEALRQGVEAQWIRAEADLIDNYQATGEATVRTFEETLQTLAELQALARAGGEQGDLPKATEDLGAILEAIQRMKEQFVAEWPWVSDQMIADARAEYARGECRSVEEILDELQGKRP